MNAIKKAWRVLLKTLRGNDVFIINRTVFDWNTQYQNGAWDRLLHSEPNTTYLASVIRNIHDNAKNLVVLDMGCGNGALAKELDGLNEIRYVGADISAAAIAQAKKQFPSRKWVTCALEDLPLYEIAPDVIVFNEVLYYVDPAASLSKIRLKVKQKNPTVLISIVNSWRSFFLWNRILKYLKPLNRTRVISKERGISWDIVSAKFR